MGQLCVFAALVIVGMLFLLDVAVGICGIVDLIRFSKTPQGRIVPIGLIVLAICAIVVPLVLYFAISLAAGLPK
jgi:hypothetical protein